MAAIPVRRNRDRRHADLPRTRLRKGGVPRGFLGALQPPDPVARLLHPRAGDGNPDSRLDVAAGQHERVWQRSEPARLLLRAGLAVVPRLAARSPDLAWT